MSISVLDLFKVGIGPSSSHTVGPMRAAHDFVAALGGRGLVDAVTRIEVKLYGSLSATGVAAPLGVNLAAIGNAAAQSASGYKALVCVFMYGGNDAYNTVLATDAESWNHYLAVRDEIAPHRPCGAKSMTAMAMSPSVIRYQLP